MSLLAREIHDQPRVLARFGRREGKRVRALGAKLGRSSPVGVLVAARGSSDHAAIYAKYLFGQRLGLPVALAAPSLITAYEGGLQLEGWLTLAISQSGASPDVVSVIASARSQGSQTLVITDRQDSDLAQNADDVIRAPALRPIDRTGRAIVTTRKTLLNSLSPSSGGP